MSKQKTKFVCLECMHESIRWMGKCPGCHCWNSLEAQDYQSLKISNRSSTQAVKLADIYKTSYKRVQTGLELLDEVMGGGVVESTINLIAGRPGVGKSTLLTLACGKLANLYPQENFLYISGEESKEQVGARFRRLGIKDHNIFILSETMWEVVFESLNDIRPKVFMIDSVQTIKSLDTKSSHGSMAQIKEAISNIMTYVHDKKSTCFLLGHITKNGDIAGPKYLEHMVDTVINFEGEPQTRLRRLTPVKNRYGQTLESKEIIWN